MLKPKTFESSDADEASCKDEYSVFDCCEEFTDCQASSVYSSFKDEVTSNILKVKTSSGVAEVEPTHRLQYESMGHSHLKKVSPS
jgi:hypothetical protein